VPPSYASAGPKPRGDYLLDQTAAFDPADAEPVPEFVFDPSLPEESHD